MNPHPLAPQTQAAEGQYLLEAETTKTLSRVPFKSMHILHPSQCIPTGRHINDSGHEMPANPQNKGILDTSKCFQPSLLLTNTVLGLQLL